MVEVDPRAGHRPHVPADWGLFTLQDERKRQATGHLPILLLSRAEERMDSAAATAWGQEQGSQLELCTVEEIPKVEWTEREVRHW